MRLNQEIIGECRKKLLLVKQELLTRMRISATRFKENNKNIGDEIDQSVAQLEEYNILINQERIRTQLLEVEFALSRIEKGEFGICEETQEPIEVQRLLTIPWTRLSIEGAELRERYKKHYAQL
ncbi:MAG: TraR/DksA family transcriptional regulator [Bdellovibrionaceae bacterium]|nr:TraR/DksA family transcriptional regulator [Bacteriovoracaceae bacterium]MCK6598387.1 TraR/DksA family transcriptional regulator [Pseudobdellovibrionaceae bacterium]NUM58367.1 TraR/DksA family transcriptional regulator [Pseudobdellovibrionaceae bacterium]